jgi:membrane protein implicated in regulation of membrane protease activity
MLRSQAKIDRAVVVCSAWLHAGYIGVVAVAAGLIQVFVTEARWPAALVLVFAGGLLAAACWRRAQAVLERAERASASPPAHRARRFRAPRLRGLDAARYP